MIRLFTPAFLFVFGLIVSIYSYQTYGDFHDFGAAFYPTIIGGLVSLFGLIDFGMELKIKGKYIFQSFDLKQDGKIILLLTLTILFYLIAVEYLGFILTTAIILIALTLPFLKSHRLSTALFLFVLAIGIYFLFAKVLMVPLASGVLFE